MAESRHNDEKMSTEELDLNSCCSIVFSCIQEDKLCKLQAVMNQYEKSQRQVIVSQKIYECAPLFIACLKGKDHFVNYLLDECNADVEQTGSRFGFEFGGNMDKVTPLLCAIERNNLEVVKILVQHGANVNKTEVQHSDKMNTFFTGTPPVIWACYNRDVSVVKYLVEHGANIHKRGIDGKTCLMNAVYNADLCSILIDNGADVNAQDKSKNIALFYAIRGRCNDTVRLLLRHKSNYSLKNDSGNDALQYAAYTGNSSAVEILLEMAPLTVSDSIGAYEILGASLVTDNMAVKFWKKAMALRYQSSSAPLLKQLPKRQSVYLHLKEPETMEELNNLNDPEEIRMNALMIRERILGPTHIHTQRGLLNFGEDYKTCHRYHRCVDLWKHAYKLSNLASDPFDKNCLSIITPIVKLLFGIHVTVGMAPVDSLVSMSNILDVLNILSEQIINQHTLLKMNFASQRKVNHCYLHELLKLFLHLIAFISRFETFYRHKHICMNIIYKTIAQDPRGIGGESLLHLAVHPRTSDVDINRYPVNIDSYYYLSYSVLFPSLDVINILVHCGANVDALQSKGYSPLSYMITYYEFLTSSKLPSNNSKLWASKRNMIDNILNYLVSKGAHVDISNYEGDSSLTIIEKMALSFSTTNHVSLQCLASRVIMKHKIPYKEVLPKFLSLFVELHGKRDKVEDTCRLHV